MLALEEIGMISVFCIVISVARYFIQQYIQDYYKGKVDDEFKFSESVWKTIIYGILWFDAIYVVYLQEFYTNTKKCWEDYPDPQLSFSFRLWFFLQLGYYWSCFFFQRFNFEVRRKDYNQMLIHHVFAIILLTGSYALGYSYIGGVILFLNDFNDWILNVGKIFLYIRKKYIADILFPVFILSWGYNRIYLGLGKVLYSCFFEARQVNPTISPVSFYTFSAGLVTLYFLNCWWFYVMCKMGVRVMLKQNVLFDSREADKAPPEALDNGNNAEVAPNEVVDD
jgi:hypothetical protein